MVALNSPPVYGLRIECPSLKKQKVFVCPGNADEDDQEAIELALDFSTLDWDNFDKRVKDVLNGVPVGEHTPIPEYEYVFYVG